MSSFGTIVTLAWPFAIAGMAWGIAVWALNKSDEMSLVQRLTTSPRNGDPLLGPALGEGSSSTRSSCDRETTEL